MSGSAVWLAMVIACGSPAVEVEDASGPAVVLGHEPPSDAVTSTATDKSTAVLRTFVQPHASVVLVPIPSDASSVAQRARWASTAARGHQALGVLWVDLTDEHDVVLYLVTVDGGRVLARTIPRDPENPAATWDALGIIAGSISSALVSGAEIGMVEVEPATEVVTDEAEPTPTAPSPPPLDRPSPTSTAGAPVQPETAAEPEAPTDVLSPWPRLRADAGYTGSSFADQVPWAHAIAAALVWRIRPVPYVGLGYRGTLPVRIEDPDVGFVIARHAVRALVGTRLPINPTLAVDLEGQGAVDIHRSRSVRAAPGLRTADGTRAVAELGLRSRVRVRLARGVELYAAVGVDLALNRFDYAVFGLDGGDVRLAPHLVRGRLSLGLSYGFVRR